MSGFRRLGQLPQLMIRVVKRTPVLGRMARGLAARSPRLKNRLDGLSALLRRRALQRAGVDRLSPQTRLTYVRLKAAIEGEGNRRRSLAVLSAPDRPRLALIVPSMGGDGQSTGAGFDILEGLSPHYEVEVVSGQPDVLTHPLYGAVRTRSFDWLEHHRHHYERLLYLVGSGEAYVGVLNLLERYPGVVILQDFFLGDLVESIGPEGDKPGNLARALYQSHGYVAVKALFDEGGGSVKARFPCNLPVVERAMGVISRSRADLEAAREWYGEDFEKYFSWLPPVADAVQADSAARVGGATRDLIERFYREHPLALQVSLIDSIVSALPRRRLTDIKIESVARGIAASKESSGPRQIFADVSSLAHYDNRTGVQRVTRSILHELLVRPPDGFRIEPVYGADGAYYYARHFSMQALLGSDGAQLDDAPIDARPGDVFLGLDLTINEVQECRTQLMQLRNQGVQLSWVVYDLLPILRAECFGEAMRDGFRAWFEAITEMGDSLIAISRATQTEVDIWLDQHEMRGLRRPRTGFFHLGADIDRVAPTRGVPRGAETFLGGLRNAPTLLMVGTVEPRKGHAQVVAAFEELWQQGQEVNLLIVGKEGWLVDALADRLRKHPERGHRLHWLETVSDEYLDMIYAESTALIAASEGEGFGLPLIEAAQHGLPIIARDLPVFREVAEEHAYYFDTYSAEGLAECIRDWLELDSRDKAPCSDEIRWLTWKESKERLVFALLETSTGSESRE